VMPLENVGVGAKTTSQSMCLFLSRRAIYLFFAADACFLWIIGLSLTPDFPVSQVSSGVLKPPF